MDDKELVTGELKIQIMGLTLCPICLFYLQIK